jgi:hypothetical protein
MDPFFFWLEGTPFSTWLREAPSIMVFPFILILHTVGLAFLVGANIAFDARVLGLARGIPLLSMRRYYRAMWAGFWVNAFSGVLLLIAYPTKALTNPVFYVKLSLIALALLVGRSIQRHLLSGAIAAGVNAPRPLKVLATVSLMLWLISITAGRLLAYTCSRLTADQTC